jgi:RHS repeat-associated protein
VCAVFDREKIAQELSGRLLSMCLLIAACILQSVCPVATFGQSVAGGERGAQPYAAFQGGDIDSINLENGNMAINLPIVSYPQRGGKLQVGLNLVYNNKNFVLQQFCNPSTGGNSTNQCGGNWTSSDPSYPQTFQGSVQVVSTSQLVLENGPYLEQCTDATLRYPGDPTCFALNSFNVLTPDGSTHQMFQTASGPVGWRAIDGSGYFMTSYGSSPNTSIAGWIIYDQQGTQINIPPYPLQTTQIEDSNGNIISNIVNSSGYPTGIKDTLGRVFPNAAATNNYAGCTGPLPITSADEFDWPGVTGGTFTLKRCYVTVQIQTNFQYNFPYNEPGSALADEFNNPAQLLQSVVLPNGQAWTFQYGGSNPNDPAGTNYGNLTQITLPTGGTISYAWKINTSFNLISSPSMAISIQSRTVDAHDGSGPHTWNYAYGSSGQTTVTDPAGNDHVHVPQSPCNVSVPKTSSDKYYQGSASSGALLRSTVTTYACLGNPFNSNTYTALSDVNVLPTSVTTTLSNGNVSRSESDYDPGFKYSVCYYPTNASHYCGTYPQPALYGKVISTRNFDYGTGAAGPLLRQIKTTYTAFGGPNAALYLANNLISLPYTVQTLNGSDTQVALTQFNYDEGSRGSSGLTSSYQFDSAPPTGNYRGNNTSVYRWLNSGALICPNGSSGGSGSNIISTATYFDAGMPYTSSQPCGSSTTLGYALNYWAAFPTSATNALGQTTTNAYDFNTGLLTSTTDPNLKQTTYSYDNLWRPNLVVSPDGGQSTNCYTDLGGSTCAQAGPPYQLVTTSSISTTPTVVNETTTTTFDGLGRVSQTALNSDPDGVTYAATTYDALGRPTQTYNPTRCASLTTNCGESTWGVSTTFYDAFGKPCLVVPPGGTLPSGNNCPTTQPSNDVFTSYSGNATTVTDQAGKSRRSVTDGLGRLIQVFEDPAGLNYETDYTYDALSNLTRVDQWGGPKGNAGDRVRSFVYDSLSRLTSATNPESGTISYSYDANGNLLQKTSPAPNQTGSATVTLSYCYDALNRLTGKAYTAQTCSNGLLPSPLISYFYDQSSYNGLSIANGIGRRTGMSDQAGSEAWSYDTLGRTLFDLRKTNGFSKTTSYSYNLDGSVLSVSIPQYPDGSHPATIGYVQGGAGRTISLTAGGATFVGDAHYTPAGANCYLQNYWDGTWTSTATFNNRNQPVTYQVQQIFSGAEPTVCGVAPIYSGGCCTSILDLAYSFTDASGHNNGNVAAITNSLNTNLNQSFTYDSLNRIASAQTASTYSTSPTNCWAESYTYDPWGNLLTLGTNSIAQSAYTGCSQENPQNFVALLGANNQLNGFGYTTDAAGNVIADGVHSFSFDAENHLVSVAQSANPTYTYTYDGDGKRLIKSSGSPATSTIYWYGAGGDALIESDLGNNWLYSYTYFNGKRIERYNPANGTAVEWYFSDHLGSARVVWSVYGEDKSEYYPFGGERVISSGAGNRYKFTGKERDSESGLDNFGARYDSSSLGRFMTPDPSSVSGDIVESEFPQSWNMYSYVLNNPLNAVDPDGLDYYLLGGDRCGQDIQCDKQGYVLGSDGNRQVVTDQQINGSNGLAKIDENGNLQINTAQGTFQGQFFDPNIGANGAAIIPQAIVTPTFEEQKFMALQDAGAMATPGVNAALAITSPQLLFMGGATIALSGGGSTLTLEAGAEVTATPGEVASISRAAAQGGRRAVQRALRSYQKRLAEHLAKLNEIKGDPGSVQREINNFRGLIKAAEEYLSKNP